MSESTPIIPAATILLCNDRPDGIETFMSYVIIRLISRRARWCFRAAK